MISRQVTNIEGVMTMIILICGVVITLLMCGCEMPSEGDKNITIEAQGDVVVVNNQQDGGVDVVTKPTETNNEVPTED